MWILLGLIIGGLAGYHIGFFRGVKYLHEEIKEDVRKNTQKKAEKSFNYIIK